MGKNTHQALIEQGRRRRSARALCAAAAGLALLSQLVALNAAAAAPPRAFENNLTRSITIQGQGEARFRLSQRMLHYRVPGISVAVIDHCRIVDARGFGTSAGGGPPITTRTLFQAGSISKTVTAVAALRLVEEGRLELDGDVRPALKSWTLKQSPPLTGAPVTLRRLLNHTAGLNEVGGKGYPRGAPLPTLAQILDGEAPANTPPIRVEKTPGSAWVYSSGGYYIVQALMTDVTGESFLGLADRLVFRPARMTESSFGQPLDPERSRLAASAVGADGSPMSGGWRVNPELAAGGLWTTPSDLARLLIALARDMRGDSNRMLTADSVREMMKPALKSWGLGVELGGKDGQRRIGHTGHNVGFVSEYVMYPDRCQGAVVMTNADQGGWLVTEVLRAIGDVYDWPDREPGPVQAAMPLTEAIADRFVGTYRLRDFPGERFTISRKPGGGLYWARIGHVGRDLLPEHARRLFSPDSRMTLETVEDAAKASTLELSFGGGKNIAERIE
jgi:CubicO group peptidase (beta-lactamase class C family)